MSQIIIRVLFDGKNRIRKKNREDEKMIITQKENKNTVYLIIL
jgi:hypothetical protein